MAVDVYPLPAGTGYANLNTAAFDGNGVLWFTGQSGIYGRFDPATEAMEVFFAPRGRGPYGINGTPDGGIYFASLAGSYVGKVDITTGAVTVLQPPTRNQGARPGVVGFSWQHLGRGMERRPGGQVRPGRRHLGRVETSRQPAPGLCDLCR